MALAPFVILMGAGFVGQAEAATFTVGTTSDTSSCDPNVSNCSLPEIINYEDGLATTPNPVDMIVVPTGTKWETIDRCDGTLTVVHRGTVDVLDFNPRKTIAAHAGHSYLAKALTTHKHK